jgi:ABC-type multidrug transport system fused ATPase/permease subunit
MLWRSGSDGGVPQWRPPHGHGLDCAWRAPPADSQTLRDVNFTIPGGTSCAVVGSSGSGKSTLLRLLFRCGQSLQLQPAV